MRDILPWVGAIVTAVAVIPYIIDIVRGRTKPNIVSWITWSLLTGIATAAAFAAHEPRTALLTLAATIGTGSVVVLGLKFGTAELDRFDVVCWAGAFVGLLLWWIFNSPAIAIIAAVTLDFVGLLPTVRHSWIKPNEETWQAFFLAGSGAIFTIVSLTAFSVESLLYPVYLFLANGIVVVVVLYRRKVLASIRSL